MRLINLKQDGFTGDGFTGGFTGVRSWKYFAMGCVHLYQTSRQWEILGKNLVTFSLPLPKNHHRIFSPPSSFLFTIRGAKTAPSPPGMCPFPKVDA